MAWCPVSLSSEVAELFASYSQADEYETQVQLELFAWAEGPGRREWWRDRKRMQRGAAKQMHACSVCGEAGHRGRWRGAVICTNEQARAA